MYENNVVDHEPRLSFFIICRLTRTTACESKSGIEGGRLGATSLSLTIMARGSRANSSPSGGKVK